MRKGRRCLYCGTPLTGREWDIGVCDQCSEERSADWRRKGTSDNGEWRYVDCGPRMKDICKPEEVDIVGAALLYEAVFFGRVRYGERKKEYDEQYWISSCDECPQRHDGCQENCVAFRKRDKDRAVHSQELSERERERYERMQERRDCY